MDDEKLNLKEATDSNLQTTETIGKNHEHELKLDEFLGWMIALLFPFTAVGLMNVTGVPLLSALIYYGVFGIYLRIKMTGRLPYFKPQLSKVKVETLLLIFSGGLCGYLYLLAEPNFQPLTTGLLLNLFVFTLLNGTFEHLVWVNIYELAGKRKKYLGVIASTIYVSLIHTCFWLHFLPTGNIENIFLFVAAQLLIFYIPLRIYVKTNDLTLWSLQHILYNSLTVLFGGFSLWIFLGM